MEPSRTALARAIDALADAKHATVTESRTTIAVYQLDAAGARRILPLIEPAGFVLSRVADEGGAVSLDLIADDSYGIEFVATKPPAPDGVLPILTRTAFRELLIRGSEEEVVWVQELGHRVDTITTRYAPWGDAEPFCPNDPPADPGRVVRAMGAGASIEPIGRWLLRDVDTDISGSLLAPWRARATTVLTAVLAHELEYDGRLLFRGPPPTRFRADGGDRIEVGVLAGLQRAVSWVYENPRELENRHGLLAAEVARTALRDGDLTDLASTMPGALEGARIAYGFGVSQQSRDALKTLSDLRKAVTDETGKLADATRALAAAMTTSAIGNAGLIIARLTIAKEARFVGPAAMIIGVALATYVAIVIISGWHFLSIQRDLRADWRERLYRFLPREDYDKMVTNPVERAEKGFKNTAIGSGVVAACILFAVILVSRAADQVR